MNSCHLVGEAVAAAVWDAEIISFLAAFLAVGVDLTRTPSPAVPLQAS